MNVLDVASVNTDPAVVISKAAALVPPEAERAALEGDETAES